MSQQDERNDKQLSASILASIVASKLVNLYVVPTHDDIKYFMDELLERLEPFHLLTLYIGVND